MGWLLPILQLLPQLPGIIKAIKDALDNHQAPMSLEEAEMHAKARSFVDVCHGAMCTK